MLIVMQLDRLTDLMDELARQTWFNLSTARRLKMRMGEVTATELNLLAMSRLLEKEGIPAELIPTRADEATTGVDFEIWLDMRGQRFFGYAIQAKILKVQKAKFTYPQLSHRDGAGTFQYDLLESHSRRTGSHPVHLFYNGWEDGSTGAPTLPNGVPADHFGCAAVMTSVVRDARSATTKPHGTSTHASVTATDYLPRAMPWSDLFRLPGVISDEAPPGTGGPGGGASGNSGDGRNGMGGSSASPGGPLSRRSLDLTISDVDALERRVAELGGQTFEPRQATQLPDYVTQARGIPRAQLPRRPDLPLYALVIHS